MQQDESQLPADQNDRSQRAIATTRITSGNFRKLPAAGAESASQNEADRELRPNQMKAIAALVAGQTCEKAAKAAGVSVRTLYSWRREAHFAQELRAASRGVLEATAARVRRMLLRSASVLAKRLRGPYSYESATKFMSDDRMWSVAQMMPRRMDRGGDGTIDEGE